MSDDVILTHNPPSTYQVAGWAGITIVNAFACGVIWANLSNQVEQKADKGDVAAIQFTLAANEKARAARVSLSDTRYQDLQLQIAALPTVQTKMDQAIKDIADQKRATEEANKRMDRIADLINTKIEQMLDKLDVVRSDVQGVKTDVKVLSSKMDDMGDAPRRTNFTTTELPSELKAN